MFAAHPGHVVYELGRIVAVGVRALGRVTDGKEAVAGESDAWDSPRHGSASFKTGDAHGTGRIRGEREEGADGIVETGVAETSIVHHVGRKNPCVGTKVLFVVGEDLGSAEVQALRRLVFVAAPLGSPTLPVISPKVWPNRGPKQNIVPSNSVVRITNSPSSIEF